LYLFLHIEVAIGLEGSHQQLPTFKSENAADAEDKPPGFKVRHIGLELEN
jgi:hypothetical protein